jgi:hypothetical protein
MTGMVDSYMADFLLENTGWEMYVMQRWRNPTEKFTAHRLEAGNSF